MEPSDWGARGASGAWDSDVGYIRDTLVAVVCVCVCIGVSVSHNKEARERQSEFLNQALRNRVGRTYIATFNYKKIKGELLEV